jgi:DNA-binding LacI/PurR family transcriptional regulator
MPSIIEQIAADLKVSNASVSRALNDRPGVGSALRERILERARELNYTPSLLARGLATSRTFTLGFFVREKPGLPTHTDPFYGPILQGMEQFCAQTDYHITIATLTEDIISEPQNFRFVRERRVDGMILAGPDIPNSFIVAMSKSDLPVVLVDNRLEFVSLNTVNSDNEGGGLIAAQHLIDCGHQSIGIATGPVDWHSTAQRIQGYERALNRAKLPIQAVHVDRTTIDSGDEAYHLLMRQYPHLTAICAVNDSMAIGIIRAAHQQGKQVPDDLSVVGFDDIDWAALNHPALSTVHIPKQQLGREAARRLIEVIDTPDTTPAAVTLAVQWVGRESTRSVK